MMVSTLIAPDIVTDTYIIIPPISGNGLATFYKKGSNEGFDMFFENYELVDMEGPVVVDVIDALYIAGYNVENWHG